MKLRNAGKRLLAAASMLVVAVGITSCGASNTVDFLYVTSNSQDPGQINAYEVDSESGAIYQLMDSPYPSGGRNPVYEVTSPNGLYLYVANHDDNVIEMFAIGTDGKLYPLQTVNTPGTEPVALAVNHAGTALYVLDYYAPASPGQPSYTDLNPGPGAVVVLPINSTTGIMGTPVAMGAANYFPVQCFPSNLTVTPDGNYVYVTNTNAVVVTTSPPVTGTVPLRPSGCPASGTVSAFAVDGTTSNGTQSVTGLTPVSGSPFTTGSGSEPTGIVADPNNNSIYVTDSALNQVYTYGIQSGGALSLTSSVGSGNMPMGATIVTSSASAKYLYVSNYNDGSISSYSLSSGAPVEITTTSSGASGPLCLMADPYLGRFLYAANYIGGKVGGLQLNPSTGGLISNMGAPYVTQGQPTCVAAIPHPGNPNGL